MAKLLDDVRRVIRAKHYSIRTEDAYVGWVREFILFHHKRHPMEMGEGETSQVLSYLATERQVAASTQNQALAAILFLYKEVLCQPLAWLDNLVRAKRPEHLPVVLTRAEVRAVLNQLKDKDHLVASLLFGSLAEGYGFGERVLSGW